MASSTNADIDSVQIRLDSLEFITELAIPSAAIPIAPVGGSI